jgi:hypothetical protein
MTRSPSCELALLGLEHQRLVVAEPHDVEHLRAAAAVLALDDAGVGHLAAAGRVERRLDELEQQVAVLRGERPDRRRLLDSLVAVNVVPKPAASANARIRSRSSSRPPRPALRARTRCSSMSCSSPARQRRPPARPPARA